MLFFNTFDVGSIILQCVLNASGVCSVLSIFFHILDVWSLILGYVFDICGVWRMDLDLSLDLDPEQDLDLRLNPDLDLEFHRFVIGVLGNPVICNDSQCVSIDCHCVFLDPYPFYVVVIFSVFQQFAKNMIHSH